MKSFFLVITSLLTCTVLSAQDLAQQTKSFRDDPFNHPQFPLFVVILFGAVVLILVALVMIYVVQVIQLLKTAMVHSAATGEISAPDTTLKRNVFQAYKWHMYGTGALLLVFIVIIVSSEVVSSSEIPPTTQLASAEVISQPEQSLVDEKVADFSNDKAAIDRGSQVFATNCGACHKNDGGGNTIGPNLTDEYWLHGGDAPNIYSTVKNGVADKGMPAWGSILTTDNVRDITSYILSLQGTNPPDAKGPQGEKFVKTAKLE
ncbi:MAG TPA: c-type cytochrome [Cyclobacteriaceae bacterium]|jgi:cytochrome c oxidase cbb3-type subunit III|nr:c-type cytochrome [Cyclobacteriaceae bacterium]HMV10544.1 c-type cytochrome [Cyclobacteriaceae bacterium]HMV89602.1 c-type cytochrome [Cyclobacteriaceae bacterium]HMW99444.1 c-type cytochrome [Cyclobacteriaceae bacterium]HMX48767.1 c-type cytochrome [Cyclobacteriaceae bacterium]